MFDILKQYGRRQESFPEFVGRVPSASIRMVYNRIVERYQVTRQQIDSGTNNDTWTLTRTFGKREQALKDYDAGRAAIDQHFPDYRPY